MWFTSSWFNQLIEADISLFENLQTVLVGGEKLSEYHIFKLRNRYPAIKIINGYGPTENTTFSLTYQVNGINDIRSIPVGRPLNNRSAYILDQYRQLVPVGVTGELYLGGDGLSLGYLKRPQLTRDTFLDVCFNDSFAMRTYKTGDLGRWLPDGNIEYLGRKDDQIKIRGYRVELGEIETNLMQSGLVSDCVVIVKEDVPGIKHLIAYVVPDGAFDKIQVADYLKTKLPEYMVPASWVKMDRLPLTSNGKVDKHALPHFDAGELLINEYVAPHTLQEKTIANIWQEVLRVKSIGLHDNFFELGGDSILTLHVVNRAKKAGYDIQAKDIFIYQTVNRLATAIAGRAVAGSVPLNEATTGQDNSTPSMKEIGSNLSDLRNNKYLVSIKTNGNKIPLYIVAGGGGTAHKFMKFARMMDPDQPVYVLQAPIDLVNLSDFPNTIEKIAAVFIEELIANNPGGPYALSGHCAGGMIAFEMARQLKMNGRKVHMLALFDAIVGKVKEPTPGRLSNLYNIPDIFNKTISKMILKLDFEMFLFKNYTRKSIGYKMKALKTLMERFKTVNNGDDLEYVSLDIFDETSDIYLAAHRKYVPLHYDGEIILFYARERYYFSDATNNIKYKKVQLNEKTKNMWKLYCNAITIYEVDGDHSDMFETTRGNSFAHKLQLHMNSAGKKKQMGQLSIENS